MSPITFTIDGVEMNIYQARREYPGPGDEAGEFRCFLRNRMRISFTLAHLQRPPLFIRCNLRR